MKEKNKEKGDKSMQIKAEIYSGVKKNRQEEKIQFQFPFGW